MNKIIVTPAGRKRYLEVLLNNLLKCRDEFDEWHLWINTKNLEDISYMYDIEKSYSFIRTIECDVPVNGNETIYRFFKQCTDTNSAYLRLDDDIVYVHKGSISSIFEFRIKNEDPFLVFGNIVNNSVLSHLHQRMGILPMVDKLAGYSCLDEIGWNDPGFALDCHNNFFDKYRQNKLDSFLFDKNWILFEYNRVSINAISWLGKTFLEFNGLVGIDEEEWLSVDKPRDLKRPNVIFGNSLFSHYSFFTQREFLDRTDVLSKYRKISLNDEI